MKILLMTVVKIIKKEGYSGRRVWRRCRNSRVPGLELRETSDG